MTDPCKQPEPGSAPDTRERRPAAGDSVDMSDVYGSGFRMEVENCARCGGDHNVKAIPFDRPPETGHSHYAECPTTGDPILVKTEDE
ncbi:MAG: hypothetical protein ABEN55_12235 [Bradymonadaceae bacterium]